MEKNHKDIIQNTKDVVQTLEKMQNYMYNIMLENINLKKGTKAEEFLFDHIFNNMPLNTNQVA